MLAQTDKRQANSLRVLQKLKKLLPSATFLEMCKEEKFVSMLRRALENQISQDQINVVSEACGLIGGKIYSKKN